MKRWALNGTQNVMERICVLRVMSCNVMYWVMSCILSCFLRKKERLRKGQALSDSATGTQNSTFPRLCIESRYWVNTWYMIHDVWYITYWHVWDMYLSLRANSHVHDSIQNVLILQRAVSGTKKSSFPRLCIERSLLNSLHSIYDTTNRLNSIHGKLIRLDSRHEHQHLCLFTIEWLDDIAIETHET